MAESNKSVTIEQTFNSSITEVWQAITEHQKMIQWFFGNIPAFEPVVGFETKFPVVSGDRKFTHLWKIIEVVPEKLIKYHWSYEEYEGTAYVTFELFERGNKTLLRLTNEGLETFPQGVPEFAEESCRAGWEYFIKGRLSTFLDNKQ